MYCISCFSLSTRCFCFVIDDSTRVPLGENKDYINASYIRIINGGQEYFYIGTQGPLPSTIDDFWQMILEHNSNVIVMITREIESGIAKCHRYWPVSMKKPLELKHCRIFLENYQILPYFTIRLFQVVRKSVSFLKISIRYIFHYISMHVRTRS